MSKVAIIGAGSVGTKLGSRLKAKHTVKYGSRDPTSAKINEVLKRQAGTTADTIEASVAWADLVILAVPGANDDAGIHAIAHSLGPAAKGKVLIDVTNPLTPWPGLEIRWQQGTSGGEALQAALPDTHVFKAFNTIGDDHFEHGDGALITPGQQLAMLYAGGPAGQDVVEAAIADIGFTPEHVGPIRYARNLEAMAELWIHMGVPGVGTAAKWGRNFHFQAIRGKQ